MTSPPSSASRQTVFVPPTSMPRTCITDILPFMIVLTGADLVTPGGIRHGGALVVDGDRIVDVSTASRPASNGEDYLDLRDHYIVPGFIDVHVHGLEGIDTLDGGDAVPSIASRLPK